MYPKQVAITAAGASAICYSLTGNPMCASPTACASGTLITSGASVTMSVLTGQPAKSLKVCATIV